jgi:hypothetical protein
MAGDDTSPVAEPRASAAARSSGASSATSPASSTGPSAPYTHRSDIGSPACSWCLFRLRENAIERKPVRSPFWRRRAPWPALMRRASPVQLYGYPGLQFLGGDVIAGEDANPFQAGGEDAVLAVHPADAGQAGQRAGAFRHKLGFAAFGEQRLAAASWRTSRRDGSRPPRAVR